jgi:hypothetical protein
LIQDTLFKVDDEIRAVSTDLKSATDLEKMEANLRLWRGICRGLGLSDEAYRLGQLMLGPQMIEWNFQTPQEPLPGEVGWREGNTMRVAVSNRGAMMGSPITFALLCIKHRYAAEKAIGLYRVESGEIRRRDVRCLNGYKRFPYAPKGDDLLGMWPLRLHDLYAVVMKDLGYEFSPGKHFITPPILADGKPANGWFCEKQYVIRRLNVRDPDSGRVSSRLTVEHGVSLPLAGLVHMGCVIPLEGGEVDRGFPGWAAIGGTIEALCSLEPHRERDIARAVLTVHPGLPDRFRRWGFVPYMPRALGGVGLLPWNKKSLKDSAPPGLRKALAVLSTDESAEVDWLVFERAWTVNQPGRHRGLAAGDVQYEVEGGSYKFYRGECPVELEPLEMNRKEFERRLTHFRMKTYLYMLDHERDQKGKIAKGFSIQPTKVSSALKRAWTALAAKWKSAKPLSNLAVSKVLELRKSVLNEIKVAQCYVDRWGNTVEARIPSDDEMLSALANDTGPIEKLLGRPPQQVSLALMSEEEKGLLQRHLYEAQLPPRRFTILGGSRSLGSVFRQRMVADHYGWSDFLFRDQNPPTQRPHDTVDTVPIKALRVLPTGVLQHMYGYVDTTYYVDNTDQPGSP